MRQHKTPVVVLFLAVIAALAWMLLGEPESDGGNPSDGPSSREASPEAGPLEPGAGAGGASPDGAGPYGSGPGGAGTGSHGNRPQLQASGGAGVPAGEAGIAKDGATNGAGQAGATTGRTSAAGWRSDGPMIQDTSEVAGDLQPDMLPPGAAPAGREDTEPSAGIEDVIGVSMGSPGAAGSGAAGTLDGSEPAGDLATGAGETRQESEPTEEPATLVRIDAQPPEVAAGEEVTLTIFIQDAADVTDVPFTLLYDLALFEYIGAVEGPFLGSDGLSTLFLARDSQTSGAVHFGASRYDRSRGVSGSGILASAVFRARQAGTGIFRFDGAGVRQGDGGFAAALFIDRPITVR